MTDQRLDNRKNETHKDGETFIRDHKNTKICEGEVKLKIEMKRNTK